VNDPVLGKRAAVGLSGLEGCKMMYARTQITMWVPSRAGWSGAGAGTEEEAGEEGARRTFLAEEPEQFARVRRCEERFFEQRLERQQQEKEAEEAEEGEGEGEASAGAEGGTAVSRAAAATVSFDGCTYEAPAGVVMRPREATVALVDAAYRQAVRRARLLASAGTGTGTGAGTGTDTGTGTGTDTGSTSYSSSASLPNAPCGPLNILDLGTGSGCVLLALLRRLRRAGVEARGVGVGECA